MRDVQVQERKIKAVDDLMYCKRSRTKVVLKYDRNTAAHVASQPLLTAETNDLTEAQI